MTQVSKIKDFVQDSFVSFAYKLKEATIDIGR